MTSSVSIDFKPCMSPSPSLRAIFPLKPSHTTTSAFPNSTSLPSIYPPKFIEPLRSISSRAASTVSSPLMSSLPFESSLTSGFSTPRIFREYILPMRANCKRFSGLHLTVAPTSRVKAIFPVDGIGTPKAGRSIPSMRPTTRTPPATIAPVLPALTQPWASPRLTISIATRRLESFLRRIAFAGCSSGSMISLACSM